jgi:hypothetical protein
MLVKLVKVLRGVQKGVGWRDFPGFPGRFGNRLKTLTNLTWQKIDEASPPTQSPFRMPITMKGCKIVIDIDFTDNDYFRTLPKDTKKRVIDLIREEEDTFYDELYSRFEEEGWGGSRLQDILTDVLTPYIRQAVQMIADEEQEQEQEQEEEVEG